MSILTYSETLFEIPICTHKFPDFPHNNHTPQDMENRRNAIDMRATGIVRRIDDLGRVVVPKEIRRTLRIREGDPLEIFTDRENWDSLPESMQSHFHRQPDIWCALQTGIM